MTQASAYYFFVSVGLFSALVIFLHQSLRRGQELHEAVRVFLVGVFFLLLGAKVFHSIFEAKGHGLGNGDIAQNAWDLLKADPWHWIRFFSPGYVLFGGIICSTASIFLFARHFQLNPLTYLDIFAISASIGIAFGRLGCYFAGCCFGAPLDSFFTHAADWRIPTQLIESSFFFLLFLYLFKDQKKYHGSNFIIFLGTYSTFRFFIEFFRDDKDRGIWMELLSTSQIISIFILLFLAAYYKIAIQRAELGKLC